MLEATPRKLDFLPRQACPSNPARATIQEPDSVEATKTQSRQRFAAKEQVSELQIAKCVPCIGQKLHSQEATSVQERIKRYLKLGQTSVLNQKNPFIGRRT